jgi:hypothetical protein
MRVRSLDVALLCLLTLNTGASAQNGASRPIANLGPIDIDFGEVNIGHRAVVPVTLRNLTTSPMNLAGGGVPSTEGFGSLGGSCSTPLAAGASCTINYHYQPTSNDGIEREASTSILLSAGGESRFVPLQFRGRGVGTMIDLSPTRFDFGEILLGQTVSVRLTMQNLLSVPVSLAGGGFNAANGFGASGGNCTSTLAAGATCGFIYSFTPGALGAVSNSTSISVSLSGGPAVSQFYPVMVSGIGVIDAGWVTLSPADVDFGALRLGRRASLSPSFTNVSSTTALVIGGTLLQQESDGMAFAGSPFNVGGGCDSGTIAAGATCYAAYVFAPRETRTHADQAVLDFRKGMVDEFEPVVMEGTGVGPLAQIYPVEADLGVVDLGTTAPVTVTVRNDGEYELVNFIGGGATSPFSVMTTCTGALAPGAQCSYTYTYSANAFSLGPREMQTSISFGNSAGLQRTQLVTIRAEGTAVLLRNGFE